MILKVLFVHYKESFPGEFMPNAMVVVDDYIDEINPEWFPRECKIALNKDADNIGHHAVIEIEVSDDDICRIVLGQEKIKGTVRGGE